MSVSRRGVLVAGAGVAAGFALPRAARAGRASVRFRLEARTLDGGEQVVAVTLATAKLGRIDPATLTSGTFAVHATATSPLGADDVVLGTYDMDRVVAAARLDRHGDVVLELGHAEGQAGGATLGWAALRGRNVRLVLEYTITQLAPLRLRGGRTVTVDDFVQGDLVDPEVDAFGYHTSRDGLKYRLYEPARSARPRPLVVWLHGGGEGASLPDYYDNETQLRANRGALGFVTAEGQRAFGGAYVVAPQSTSFWLEDGDRFAPQIRAVIDEVVRRHRVDASRIHVVGCSNGGYMSLKVTTVYPELFASSVPICGVVQAFQPGGPRMITDAELAAIGTPTWLVASRDDDTVAPEPNTVHAHDLIPGSRLSLYDRVEWGGYRFPGHWSWIYVGRNDPRVGGERIWQWMARQRSE
ncbi:prolyl oligopeptidase family serine peptidase [Actinoplanes rectilineatus]|uniref:prolyl oligopeptidase family serine peptidase n=1 Tax=Actinoplanes rectilineatus TaxID=113571 RepID=UPI0005F28676|nr:PHB depolymerase family esterase [Actinoplanes rectilineatus]